MQYYSFYPEYVSVAERKKRNKTAVEKLAKKGYALNPVVLDGSKIAKTFWGKSWCKNIESYEDYEYRMGRGRSYVRHGAVLDLQITQGQITALVQGSYSAPYNIRIEITPLPRDKWDALRSRCTGQISSLLSLIQGKLPDEILKAFCEHDTGLFPAPYEIELECDCPDSAGLCKHLAAVMYGIGARLDSSPELFFTLRGIDQNELLSTGAVDTLTAAAPELDTAALSDTFGIELDTLDAFNAPAPAPVAKSPKKKSAIKTAKAASAKSAAKTAKSKAAKTTKGSAKKSAPPAKSASTNFARKSKATN